MNTSRNYCKQRSDDLLLTRADISILNSRHLQRHDFYVCRKCYQKFEDLEAEEIHNHEDPCIKACRNRRCSRYLPSGSTRTAHCDCIRSPEEQWRQLFLVQYPDMPVPELTLSRTQNTIEEAEPTSNETDFDSLWNGIMTEFQRPEPGASRMNEHTSDGTVHDSIETIEASSNEIDIDNILAQLDSDTIDLQFPEASATGANHITSDETTHNPTQPTLDMRIDETLFSDVQTLRQRVQLLEQRLSQPTDREQDLEMVLGNVWQALVRAGSADAQPESPVWRLVRRFAGGVLSTAPRPSHEAQPPAAQSPPPQYANASMLDMRNLLGSRTLPDASKPLNGPDSGYGSSR